MSESTSPIINEPLPADSPILEYARSVLGDLPPNWRYARVGELEAAGIIEEVQDGNHGEKHPKSTDYVPTGVPFVMAKDIINNRLNLTDCNFITRHQADSLRIGFARPGDVLLTHKATMGRVAVVPEGLDYVMLTPQVTYYRIKDKQKLDPLYLKYAFLSPRFQHQLNASSDQSTRKYIGITAQRDLWFPLPPPKVQKRIAEIVGTLDDKIELNRQMNETLEAMARRLFRSWFVDFDPVHAKAAARREFPGLDNAELSRRALPNMSPEIAELFPDTFEESPLGPIPKGWIAGTVPDAIDINPTRAIPKGKNVPWLEMSNMPTQSARALAWEYREFSSGMKFMNGDTLVARITPCLENGKTAFVDFLEDGQVGAGSTEYIVLRPKPPLPPGFAYFLARTEEFRQHLIANMTGTSGRQRAPAESLKSFPTVIPSKELCRPFKDAIDNIIEQMRKADDESIELTAIRDRLLPSLLSGEFDLELG